MNELGMLVREIRTSHDLSLREAARRAGISLTYFRNIEAGVDSRTQRTFIPSPHVLKRLADLLRVDYAHLMRLAGHPVPDPASDVEELVALYRESTPEIQRVVLELLRSVTKAVEK